MNFGKSASFGKLVVDWLLTVIPMQQCYGSWHV